MSRISRRDFLKVIGAGSVGAGAGFGVAHSAKRPREQYVPYVVTPEDYSPGIATWYHTVCGMCSAGCGIAVRVREGRAKKIEGNALHPVSQGRSCALGQAGLNVLYHPDRVQTPLRRTGERGAGEFEPIGWDEALAWAGERIGAAGRGRVRVLSGADRGHMHELVRQFTAALGAGEMLRYDPTRQQALYAANRIAFGIERLPYYDVRNADYLVSFGADFLGAWLSPVHHSLGYGHMRQGEGRTRGHLVQIEQRMSLTGANADEWLPAAPGGEGLIALAMAHELVANGRYAGPERDAWRQALSAYSPAAVATRAGIDADRIGVLAEHFASSDRPLALAGGAAAAGTNGVATLLAVNALNVLAGNLGRPGGVLFNPEPPFGPGGAGASMRQMQALLEDARGGALDVLLVHEANPAFTLPAASGAREALGELGTLISIGSFLDETAVLADLVLPTHTFLETWWDDTPEPGVGLPVASIAQPVIAPLYAQTRPAAEVFIGLAKALGGAPAAALRWDDAEAWVREQWQGIYEARRGDIEQPDFGAFWDAVLQAGVWGEQAAEPAAGAVQGGALRAGIASPEPRFEGDASEFPFVLQPYQSMNFHDGRAANLPWMQELPDPLTGAVYGSWIEINPARAEELDIRAGDVLELRSPAGRLVAPALPYPGIRPDVLAMPIGQGHSHYGRYANGHGVDPRELLVPVLDEASGELASAATRVQIRKTGKRVRVLGAEGVNRTLGRQILGPPDDGHA